MHCARHNWRSPQRYHRDDRPMFSKCPACSSFNVRRSTIRPSEALAKPRLRSPYRCRDCGERFWVVSRRAHYALAIAALAVVAGIVAWNVSSTPQQPRLASAEAINLADMIKRANSADSMTEYKLAHLYAGGSG